MSNIDVSVIVPVYKVEKYLRKCLQSIVSQTHSNIEIILIDDGSPDGCPAICEEYAKADNRVKVIHQDNHGLSYSRNVGIDMALGEYLMFVDSDDSITSDAVEVLFSNAKSKNLDISLGGLKAFCKKLARKTKKTPVCGCVMSGSSLMKLQIETIKFHASVWHGIYKRKLIIENSLYFKNGLIHEDELWTPQVYLKAGRVSISEKAFYLYNSDNSESITRRADRTQNGVHLIKICHELEKVFKKVAERELEKILMDHVVSLYIFGIMYGNLHTEEHQDKIDMNFIRKKAYFTKTKAKVLLFCISRRLYKLIFERLNKY